MRIFRNGALAYDETTGDDFDDSQLSQISLAMSAIDAEVGMGSAAVPGDPGWNAGDRITFYEGGPTGSIDVVFGGIPVTFGGIQVVWTNNGPWGEYLIYTGFVGQHSRIRNPNSPLEVTSIYQLMDPNRQLIGRRVVDFDANSIDANNLFAQFVTTYLTDLDLDQTYVLSNSTALENQLYTGDGIMDVLAQLVLFTGWTVFLVVTQTENRYELHIHSITNTGYFTLMEIDDTPGAADNVTVFAPRDPEVTYDPTDLKNDIQGRNGLGDVVGQNTTSQDTYDVGGLHWGSVLSYGVDQNSLATYVNTLLNQAFERITYSCTIGPLDGSQIIQLPAGAIMPVTSVVWGIPHSPTTRFRINRITLTPAQGSTVAPGLWDAHLELNNARRLPSQTVGLGGQGGYSGSLTDPFNAIDHYQPVSGGQFIASDIPVGGTYRINYQMVDKYSTALAIPGDTAFFTLEMWQDVAETVPGDGWSISVPVGGDVSDTSGQVYVDLSHDTTGTSIVVNVVCSR